MSSQTLPAADRGPTRSPLPTFARTLAAELVRARRSPSSRIPLLGFLMCVVQGVGWWTVSTRELSTWQQLFAWQALWATGIAAPITALVVGLAVQRERQVREGGTLWRAIRPFTIQLARSTVLMGQLLALQLLVSVPIIVFGWAKGLSDAPVLTMATLAIVLWAGNLPWAALALFLSRVAGLWVAVGVGLAWQLAGTLQAESPSWTLLPWTWSVRPALPLLGVQANGVGLAPDSPVWDYSVGTPVVMAAGVGILALLLVALFTPRVGSLGPRLTSWPPSRRGSAPTARAGSSTRPGLVRGLLASLRRTSMGWLVGLTLIVITLVAVIWPASYVPGLVSLVVLPLGSCLLACLVWATQQPSWRALALRRSPERLGLGLGAVCLLILTLIVLSAGVGMALHGGFPVLFAAVAWSTGAALLAVNLLLVTRLGVGAAVGLTLIAWILGVALGASQLASTPAWLGSFAIWPYAADTLDRAVIAIPISLAVALLAGRIWLGELRRAAAS